MRIGPPATGYNSSSESSSSPFSMAFAAAAAFVTSDFLTRPLSLLRKEPVARDRGESTTSPE